VEARSLSLAAEVLLLSIDPGDGGLLAERRRVKRAVGAAGGSLDDALAELEQAGLVRGSLGLLGDRVALVDRAPAGVRFRALQQAIRDDTLEGDREWDLFVLLAQSGVLARRLPRNERRAAASRLRKLDRMLEETPAGPSAVWPLIAAREFTAVSDGDGLKKTGLLDPGGRDYDDSGGGGQDFSHGAL
jgi:hypothetical protein